MLKNILIFSIICYTALSQNCNHAVLENYYDGSLWTVPTDMVSIEAYQLSGESNYFGYQFSCSNNSNANNFSLITTYIYNSTTSTELVLPSSANFKVLNFTCGLSSCNYFDLISFGRNQSLLTSCNESYGVIRVKYVGNVCQRNGFNESFILYNCSTVDYFNDSLCTSPTNSSLFQTDCLQNCTQYGSGTGTGTGSQGTTASPATNTTVAVATTTTAANTTVAVATTTAAANTTVAATNTTVAATNTTTATNTTVAVTTTSATNTTSAATTTTSSPSIVIGGLLNSYCDAVDLGGYAVPTGICGYSSINNSNTESWMFECNNGSLLQNIYTSFNCTGPATTVNNSSYNYMCGSNQTCNTVTFISGHENSNNTCSFNQYKQYELITGLCLTSDNTSSSMVLGCNSHAYLMNYIFNDTTCSGLGTLDYSTFPCPNCNELIVNPALTCPAAVLNDGAIPLNVCVDDGKLYQCDQNGNLKEIIYSNGNCTGNIIRNLTLIADDWYCGNVSNSSLSTNNDCDYITISSIGQSSTNSVNGTYVLDVCTNFPSGFSAIFAGCNNANDTNITYTIYNSWDCSGNISSQTRFFQSVKCFIAGQYPIIIPVPISGINATTSPSTNTTQLLNATTTTIATTTTTIAPTVATTIDAAISQGVLQFVRWNNFMFPTQLCAAAIYNPLIIMRNNSTANNNVSNITIASPVSMEFRCNNSRDLMVAVYNMSSNCSGSVNLYNAQEIGVEDYSCSGASLNDFNAALYLTNQSYVTIDGGDLNVIILRGYTPLRNVWNINTNTNKTNITNNANSQMCKQNSTEYAFVMYGDQCIYDNNYNISWRLIDCINSRPSIAYYQNTGCNGGYTYNHSLSNCFSTCQRSSNLNSFLYANNNINNNINNTNSNNSTNTNNTNTVAGGNTGESSDSPDSSEMHKGLSVIILGIISIAVLYL